MDFELRPLSTVSPTGANELSVALVCVFNQDFRLLSQIKSFLHRRSKKHSRRRRDEKLQVTEVRVGGGGVGWGGGGQRSAVIATELDEAIKALSESDKA